MDATIAKDSSMKIGFVGEQILSYWDEMTRIACPLCGEMDLSIGIVGKNLVIRCSEALADYNDDEDDRRDPIQLPTCSFAKIVRRTSLSDKPFTLNVGQETRRGTAKNSKAPVRRGRPRKTG